jgi:hypothetical protein
VSDNPYIYLFTKLIVAMAIRGPPAGINEPCDFIFDEQEMICDEIWANWSTLKLLVEERRRPDLPLLIGGKPKFENDEDFKPLQAADLFANQYRNYLQHNSGRIIVPPSRFLQQLLPIRHIEHNSTAEELERLRGTLLDFRDQLLDIRQQNFTVSQIPRKREG